MSQGVSSGSYLDTDAQAPNAASGRSHESRAEAQNGLGRAICERSAHLSAYSGPFGPPPLRRSDTV